MPDDAGADAMEENATGEEPDAALYLALNPDLATAFTAGSIRNAAEHWRDCGRLETASGARPALFDQVRTDRRAATNGRGAPELDTRHYLAMNPDLRAAFGEDEDAAVRHWIEHGSLEGRVATGDAPHRDRAPDLAALLARPFGVDLYLPADENSLAGSAGRRLLAALRRAGIPAAPRPFVDQDDLPLLSDAEVARGGTFRVSVIVASPHTLRRLVRLYSAGHFDASYVVAFWPVAALAAHMPDYPTFGAVDEVWLPSAAARDRMAAVAPVPIRLVELPAAPLPSRRLARHRLGLPPDLFTVLLDAPLVTDGQNGLAMAGHVVPAIAAFRTAFGPDGTHRLIVRAEPRAIAYAQAAIAACPNAVVLGEQRQDGASLLLAAADVAIASDGLAVDRADAELGDRSLIGDAGDLAAALRRAEAAAPDRADHPLPPDAGDRIRSILTGLGLDVPTPSFVRMLGRSRTASLPVIARPAGRAWSPDLPILSVLLDARAASMAELGYVAAGMDAQSYPFWELCIAHSAPERGRHLLASDPRIRLINAAGKSTSASAVNRAASVATGTHIVIARCAAEASAVAGALAAIAARLEANRWADVLLAASPGVGNLADRIDAGGPAVRPVAWRRDAFERAGGLNARHDPASEYALLLDMRLSGAAVARCQPSDAPLRDPEPPAAEEAGRLALQAHLADTSGPLAYVAAGLRPFTYRRRTHLTRSSVLTVLHPAGAAPPRSDRPVEIVTMQGLLDWSGADLPTEHLVFLDGRVTAAADALAALLEIIVEDEVGAAGGRVRAASGALHHAGLRLTAGGRLHWPNRGAADDPAGDREAPFVVHNPDAVGGGVLATRRSVLLQLGGFDRVLREAEGATFDLLAADFCLRAAASGLRTTYTPFAVFDRVGTDQDEQPVARSATPAKILFATRWRTRPPIP